MQESGVSSVTEASKTETFLLTKQKEPLLASPRVKVAVVGSAPKGVAVAIAILFKVGMVIIDYF